MFFISNTYFLYIQHIILPRSLDPGVSPPSQTGGENGSRGRQSECRRATNHMDAGLPIRTELRFSSAATAVGDTHAAKGVTHCITKLPLYCALKLQLNQPQLRILDGVIRARGNGGPRKARVRENGGKTCRTMRSVLAIYMKGQWELAAFTCSVA